MACRKAVIVVSKQIPDAADAGEVLESIYADLTYIVSKNEKFLYYQSYNVSMLPPESPTSPRSGSHNPAAHAPKDESGLISIPIPSKIFRDRKLSVLEAIVEYMKDELDLTFHDIARLLNRDDRTVWTVYSRTKKKRKEYEKGD